MVGFGLEKMLFLTPNLFPCLDFWSYVLGRMNLDPIMEEDEKESPLTYFPPIVTPIALKKIVN